MADEYIKREDAMWAACKALCHPGVRCPDNCCIEVRKVFNAIPAADVAPIKRGRWTKHETEDGYSLGANCSACGGWFCMDLPLNFCPACGAVMDEDMREVDDGD